VRRTILLAVAVAAIASVPVVPAGARSEATRVIRPAVGIGKLRLGMTEAQVRRALGKPKFVVTRRTSFGLRSIEYQYGLADYIVRLSGRPGRLRAVRVGTTLVRERTTRGIGVGSTERAVRRAYPALRCEPLQTERFGSVRVVRTIQRECTLFGPSGRRTIFTTDVYERMFEVITPATWSRRARVIEVSVAAAG
jgi:hypothetical protein